MKRSRMRTLGLFCGTLVSAVALQPACASKSDDTEPVGTAGERGEGSGGGSAGSTEAGAGGSTAAAGMGPGGNTADGGAGLGGSTATAGAGPGGADSGGGSPGGSAGEPGLSTAGSAGTAGVQLTAGAGGEPATAGAGGEPATAGAGGATSTAGAGGQAGAPATTAGWVLPGDGCPNTSGNQITGVVRLDDLHATPEPSGPSVIVNMPCGREIDDPTKASCGEGHVLALLCTTPDCSDPSDPVRSHLNMEGSLQQSSFDSEAFTFCGVEDGSYYILPVIDHDESDSLSNYDWTMGIKNLADTSAPWPARVEGYAVDVTGDVDLSTALTGTNASPVAINFFNYRHPTPAWKSEPAWMFFASTLHPDVSTTGMGIRVIDLETRTEVDQQTARAGMNAMPLADADGLLYEGTLMKLAFHDGVAYLGTDTPGVILTAALGSDGSVVQGNSIDLRASGLDFGTDVMHRAAVVSSGGTDWLVIATRQSDGTPVPHTPTYPIVVVDLAGLDAGNVTSAVAIDSNAVADLYQVRLDDVVAVDGVVYAVETGINSRARQNDQVNRLWAFTLDGSGNVASHQTYAGDDYNAEGDVPECGSNPPYAQAALWVGNFNGATHAFVGNLRTVSVWRFDNPDPTVGERVQHGTGITAFDTRLDDFSVGYSVMRPSPDGSKLFVFGDCKSRYLSVRPGDWAGDSGSRTQSRRRIAVLDLEAPDADGVPEIYTEYGDSRSVPDIVREGLNGADQTLSTTRVGGVGMDCRAVQWDIYDTYGYLNVAGNSFGADCAANRVRDAVVTDQHIYIVGRGNPATGTTGLGVSSEVLLLDLAEGQEVLDPGWQWFYEGSAFQERYGYFGLTLGERTTTEVTRGAFLVAK